MRESLTENRMNAEYVLDILVCPVCKTRWNAQPTERPEVRLLPGGSIRARDIPVMLPEEAKIARNRRSVGKTTKIEHVHQHCRRCSPLKRLSRAFAASVGVLGDLMLDRIT